MPFDIYAKGMIAYNSLAKIEIGARTPSLDLLADMKAYFNVKLDFLVFGIED